MTSAHSKSPFAVFGVVPDVLDAVPPKMCTIKYGHGSEVQTGNEISPAEAHAQPIVSWHGESNLHYTLAMCDPDAPSKDDPKMAQWLHWLVVNIPGSDLSKGDVIVEYMGPSPPHGTDFHRYVFSIWEHHDKVDARKLEKIPAGSTSPRQHWDLRKFIETKYRTPPTLVYGNFFQSKS